MGFAMGNSDSFKSEILLNTKYAYEEFNLTWKIANFSQIFDIVHADFSLERSSTSWRLKLVNKRFINLHRCDSGEPVNADFKYRLATSCRTYEGELFCKFDNNNTIVRLLTLEAYEDVKHGTSVYKIKTPTEFEDDVLKFICTMKFVGPARTKIVRSSDLLKPNMDRVRDDLKKLLDDRDHCDVTISSGGQTLPVHKAILCARSEVFSKMFQIDMLESKNHLIELDDLDFDTINNFITFLYAGDVKIDSLEKAMSLYYAADKYEVHDLREKCSSYLELNLHVDEACTVLKMADLYRDDKLKCAVSFFIQMHSVAVKLTDGWKGLVKRYPKLAVEVFK